MRNSPNRPTSGKNRAVVFILTDALRRKAQYFAARFVTRARNVSPSNALLDVFQLFRLLYLALKFSMVA
jgi:hypothetical protein